jgi:hypothetical protein
MKGANMAQRLHAPEQVLAHVKAKWEGNMHDYGSFKFEKTIMTDIEDV